MKVAFLVSAVFLAPWSDDPAEISPVETATEQFAARLAEFQVQHMAELTEKMETADRAERGRIRAEIRSIRAGKTLIPPPIEYWETIATTKSMTRADEIPVTVGTNRPNGTIGYQNIGLNGSYTQQAVDWHWQDLKPGSLLYFPRGQHENGTVLATDTSGVIVEPWNESMTASGVTSNKVAGLRVRVLGHHQSTVAKEVSLDGLYLVVSSGETLIVLARPDAEKAAKMVPRLTRKILTTKN